ncbi:MAG: hypothetical protein EB023_03355, partial [Flavobacteriia bacterium]|nr:hypothetical protein [Flavobacteriia bacterium]
HLGLVGLAFFIMLVFRKKVNERADKVLKIRTKIALKVLRTFLWILFFVIGYLVFWTTDSFYKRLFFNSTQYENLGNMNLTDFKRHLTASSSVIDQPTTRIFWEVYTKEHQQWKMKRMKKVLYFKVLLDSLGNKLSLRFSGDSEEIRWGNQRKKAQTHLIVYSYYNTQGQFIGEEIFNYAGNSLEKKFKQKDPAKRILVFVNGYRPVANGGTPSDALLRVQKNGIEFPDSKNICYTNDRFNYWGPWGGFDQKFIDRIKPNEVYYADGHHSVATSNYGSILEFVQTASDYPKPCKGTHHCTYYTESGKRKKTIRQLPFTPNTKGFLERRQNGKIAGKNLLQLLNEVPGNSGNDTLYLVAHSMGFAYALGMIDALGKACQYKTFYVIAPENAESGKINPQQWHRVYQYGCFTSGPLMQPACLQDGVAPQSGIRGLPSAFRFTFPTDYHKKMGFTGSHFVGYYDWIFDIPPHQEGAVQKN